MNKITQDQLKTSHKLLNEYYLTKYNTQMGRLNKFVSEEMIIEEEGDPGVIDENEEIQFERSESMKLEKRKQSRNERSEGRMKGDISREEMNRILASGSAGYSKYPANKPPPKISKEKSKEKSPHNPPSSPTKSDTPAPRKDLFDLSRPLNSIRQVSETQSLFGPPPKSLFTSKSKQPSSISPKHPSQDDDTRSMGQKSYYSAAVQSKLSKTSSSPSPLRKSKRQKKNFKKAFMQKKYQTTNLNQTTYKSQHQTELHVRQIAQPDLINFSMVAHQRKQEQEDKRQEVVLVKDWKKVGGSLERELREEGNWENVPEVPNGKSTLLVVKPVKELLVDHTSIFQNVEVREYGDESDGMEEEEEEDGGIQEESEYYEKVGQIFDERIERARTTSPLKLKQGSGKIIEKIRENNLKSSDEGKKGKSSRSEKESSSSKNKPVKNTHPNNSSQKRLPPKRQDQQPQQPSLPPSKYSQRDDSSVFSSQYNYTPHPQTPSKPLTFPTSFPPNATTQKKYIHQIQQKRRQQEQHIFHKMKSQQVLRQRKRKLSYEKEEALAKVEGRERVMLRKSIDQISKLLTNSSIQFNVQEMLVATLRKLVADSDELEGKREKMAEELREARRKVEGLGQKGNGRKKSQYHEEIESLMEMEGEMDGEVVSDDEDEEEFVNMNKGIIRKLVRRCCEAIQGKVERERERDERKDDV